MFVNSALGEIRNIVFSRGVSARSLEAAGGYFYVSLQEDGLPVEPALRLERVTLDELLESARDQGIDNLSDIRLGILEPSGQFSFLKRSNDEEAQGAPEKHKA